MKLLFAILLVLEIGLLLCAVGMLPWMRSSATILFAANSIVLIMAGKRLRKKRDCCS